MDRIKERSLRKSSKKVITELAGNGAVVIVSPAVISGAMDITDDVLKRLGLPTDVPVTQAPRGLVLGNNANELMSENKSNSVNQALTVKQKAQSALVRCGLPSQPRKIGDGIALEYCKRCHKNIIVMAGL